MPAALSITSNRSASALILLKDPATAGTPPFCLISCNRIAKMFSRLDYNLKRNLPPQIWRTYLLFLTLFSPDPLSESMWQHLLWGPLFEPWLPPYWCPHSNLPHRPLPPCSCRSVNTQHTIINILQHQLSSQLCAKVHPACHHPVWARTMPLRHSFPFHHASATFCPCLCTNPKHSCHLSLH